jgi:polyisoprenyl-phosphate glycosyltransferase
MISVIIPALNEEAAIVDTVSRAKAVLKELGADGGEVIVINDGSRDNTGIQAANAGATVINHPHNAGYGRSLKSGILVAKNEILVITDSDGTYPIERISDLYAEYQKGFDMVVGARTGANYDESFKKKILRLILKNMVEFTAGRKIDDINSGLRMFSRTSVLKYMDTLCDTFSFTTSLTLAYMMTGRFVKYIPIEYHKRVGKTNVRLFRDTLRTLQYIVEAILYYNPIKIFIVLSFLTLMFSVLNFGLAFFLNFNTFFWLGVGSILLSILIFSIGLVAVLLKQILMNQKKL